MDKEPKKELAKKEKKMSSKVVDCRQRKQRLAGHAEPHSGTHLPATYGTNAALSAPTVNSSHLGTHMEN